MSATMGYAVVAELSHELETLLDLIRRGDRDVNASLMDTLFAATDTLERAIELSVGGRGDELDIRESVAALREAGQSASTVSAGTATAAKTAARVARTRNKRGGKPGSPGAAPDPSTA